MPSHSGPDQHSRPTVRTPTGSSNRRTNAKAPPSGVMSTGSTGRRSAGRRTAQPAESRHRAQEVKEIERNKAREDSDRIHENGDGHEDKPEPETKENDHVTQVTAEENDDTENTRTRFFNPETEVPPKPETPPPPPQPEVYSFEKFNDTMDSYSDAFSHQKYMNVTDNYPVDDIKTLINDVTGSVDEFKQHTLNSQRHIEALRERIRNVRDRIQEDIRRKTNALHADDETESIEEKELRQKLARLNTQVAHANAELAEALRLSAETETVAAEAQLAAERAKQEAQNIQEEIAFRAKVEERRREQEKKRQEEERRHEEMQRLQEAEMKKEKEAEWKRREHGYDKPPVWETWPLHEYKLHGGDVDLACLVRGNPNTFNPRDLTVSDLPQLDCPVPFKEHEELVSAILEITGREDASTVKEAAVICVPFKAPKQIPHGHVSREPVIKIETGGNWTCLETREETLHEYKDYKFAVAEVKTLTKLAVCSRLRRDYSTISKRGGKVTSSYDQRISMTIPKNCIQGNDHIVMEVQPVDSGVVNDLKTKGKNCKGLLNSSPIVHMEWESGSFEKPVTVTVPCPPNPAKAKKIAAMRKAKEEKMKNPRQPVILLPHEIEAMEKEKQKSKLQKMQEQLAAEENQKDEPKPTKWYMGEYAVNEDDENDNLYLVTSSGNKWTPVENVNIVQVKLDLLQFDLDKPLEKFMVLRTRTNVDEDIVGSMASEVNSFLGQKFVQVILKQKSTDAFDTVLSVIPASKTEKTLKKLSQEGYDDGPDPSQVLSVNEGDVIEVGFRGNIKNRSDENIEFVYNSNLASETEFHACEVDKYLQRSFPVYRGVVEVYRKYKVKTNTKRKRRDSTDEQEEPPYEHRRDLMCELSINIPKHHAQHDSTVIRAPVTIRNDSDPVNEDLIRFVAEELGDEWKTVACHLNISKPRVQAIVRNMQYGDQSDSDARYDMLMTWLKKTPKAVDKVSCLSTALLKSGRGDLAEEIRSRDRDFRETHRSH